MKSFDLHCDTVGECFKKALSLNSNSLHFDLVRAESLRSHTQVFAVWIPDELRGKEAFDYFNKVADYFYNEIEKNSDLISLYSENRKTPVKAILALEGGSGMGGDIQGAEMLYERGVRLITLTWNGKNEIASGAYSEGGFTDYGRELVSFCEKSGIVIDASHLNRQSFFELAEISSKPFIASHSNADIVKTFQGRKRNLSLEQIEIIKNRHGLIGLNFFKEFLEDKTARGFDALRRQLDFFLLNDCEDILAIGSDYDGCEISDDFCGVERLKSIYDKLLSYGYNEALLKKMFNDNAEKFFDKNFK